MIDPLAVVSLAVSLAALAVALFRRVQLTPTEAALRGFAYAEQWSVTESKAGRRVTSEDKRKMALEAAKRLAPKLSHATLHTALEAEVHRSKK